MERCIVIEELVQTPKEDQQIELVERKAIGHPDSIADGLSETVSRSLSRMYMEKYGKILHHNTDETQIVGGQAQAEFGGGLVLEPIYILLVGRAVTRVGNDRLPYRTVALGAARKYLQENFATLNVEMDISLDCRISQGSEDLRGLYEAGVDLANDTSFGIGYAPYSETETIVLNTAHHINGPLKAEFPAFGEDVKVMGARKGDDINLTIAVAMVDRHVSDADEYMNLIQTMKDRATDFASKYTDRSINVFVNTADEPTKDIYYLTVTGLSMENGDDGSVGRGNRSNGLITPGRPMSMEASAGKNPVTHVGKLYNLLSTRIANDIIKETGGDIMEAYVRLLSQIGSPISHPFVADAQLIPAPGVDVSKFNSSVTAIFEDHLDNIERLREDILADKVTVF
jgi:S-adenosylmethionine synthetase